MTLSIESHKTKAKTKTTEINKRNVLTSTRQISKPALLPAFEKAGFMTGGLEFLFPCVFVVGCGITALARPPVVAAKQTLANDSTNSKL